MNHCFSLNGTWALTSQTGEQYSASVPGSGLAALRDNQKLTHPYWRCEEKNPALIAELNKDWIYSCTFSLPKELYGCQEEIELCFDGIDTLAEITLNGKVLGTADNMHRSWSFSVSELLYMEQNTLSVRFTSALRYAQERFDNGEITYINTGTMPGSNYVRKAHYMYGWDWGPQLPDMGFWKDVYLKVHQSIVLEDVYLTQIHDLWNATVEAKVNILSDDDSLPAGTMLVMELTSPQGEVVHFVQTAEVGENTISVRQQNPQLWWPNGLGDQPLYTVSVRLETLGRELDVWERKIGLRTLRVSRDKDQWGEEFAFECNGVKFFAMGADYIPQDNFPTTITRERTRMLLEDCRKANFNSVRVWGGGYYPEDDFFDLCDELGLVVWQDCMFACNIYQLDAQFAGNIARELVEQIKRIRHHACLGLWCGNNEMEEAWVTWSNVYCHSAELKKQYHQLFEEIFPEIFAKYDPNTLYWPSSPSTEGNFIDPNDPNRGDVHYWQVWHGDKPFEEYQKHYFRFCSEFGFQSFPCLKTAETFTQPDDRNIFSPVMENHQKNPAANSKILSALSLHYRYPNSFDNLTYVSQLLQAEAMKYGVEHWRRHRGRCMGAIYWQLNDCWPVASWSSIDWYGRWKALHYYAKRFFAPFTASIVEKDGSAAVYVLNETREEREGVLRVFLRDKHFNTVFQTALRISAPAMSSTCVSRKIFPICCTIRKIPCSSAFSCWRMVQRSLPTPICLSRRNPLPLRIRS